MRTLGLAFALVAVLASTAHARDYFTAAVFEHRPRANISDRTPEQVMAVNMKFYERAAIVAAQKGVDIIVFNEFGLLTYEDNREILQKYAEHTPDPRKVKGFNPCLLETSDRPSLYALSCLARENSMYVVGNLGDIQPCEQHCEANRVENCKNSCPPDGVLLYNTNVAFDREGNLIARYHKMHPYLELMNIPEEPEMITFSTEMGTFGLIVCFDSVFPEALKLAKEHGVDTMIFPTYWFDDILPLNGVEWQQAWALGNGVNFFAANTQTSGSASIGSGIYSKTDGALVYTFEPDKLSKLLVANVKIRDSAVDVPDVSSVTVITEHGAYPKPKETGDLFPEHCFDSDESKSLPLLSTSGSDLFDTYKCFKSQTEGYALTKLVFPTGKASACHNEFCCSVEYTADSMDEDFYLAVFNGTNRVKDQYQWVEESCMLTRCDPLGGKTCFLESSRSKTVFKSVVMRARFTAEAIYPTVSKSKHRLACKKEWTVDSGEETVLEFSSETSEPLLKVALLGRCYGRDPPFNPFYKY